MLGIVLLFNVTACGTTKCSHSYSSEITKAATCKESGIKTYTCSICGDSYTEKIGMIVHKEGEKCFSCIIKMPSPPMTLNWYMRIYIDGSFKNVVYSSTKITNITYKYNETSKKLNFYFTGEITYLSNDHHLAEFSIVLYDSKGYSVGSRSFIYNAKNGGYKFKDDLTWMWIELDLNETYTLVLSDYYS